MPLKLMLNSFLNNLVSNTRTNFWIKIVQKEKIETERNWWKNGLMLVMGIQKDWQTQKPFHMQNNVLDLVLLKLVGNCSL